MSLMDCMLSDTFQKYKKRAEYKCCQSIDLKIYLLLLLLVIFLVIAINGKVVNIF